QAAAAAAGAPEAIEPVTETPKAVTAPAEAATSTAQAGGETKEAVGTVGPRETSVGTGTEAVETPGASASIANNDSEEEGQELGAFSTDQQLDMRAAALDKLHIDEALAMMLHQENDEKNKDEAHEREPRQPPQPQTYEDLTEELQLELERHGVSSYSLPSKIEQPDKDMKRLEAEFEKKSRFLKEKTQTGAEAASSAVAARDAEKENEKEGEAEADASKKRKEQENPDSRSIVEAELKKKPKGPKSSATEKKTHACQEAKT
ncbi:unnamed protein product, partial [Durusdinium trenchii]